MLVLFVTHIVDMLVGGGKGATCRRTAGAGADGVMVVMREECVGLGMEELNRGRAGCCLHGRRKLMQVAVNTTVRATVRRICWISLLVRRARTSRFSLWPKKLFCCIAPHAVSHFP
jgi:hypothetical protein